MIDLYELMKRDISYDELMTEIFPGEPITYVRGLLKLMGVKSYRIGGVKGGSPKRYNGRDISLILLTKNKITELNKEK